MSFEFRDSERLDRIVILLTEMRDMIKDLLGETDPVNEKELQDSAEGWSEVEKKYRETGI